MSLKKRKKDSTNKMKSQLTLGFILSVAAILVISVMIVVILEYFIIQTNLIADNTLENSGLLLILLFGLASIIVGTALSTIVSSIMLKPIDLLIQGMSRLSDGDYTTRINLGKYQVMKNMANSFNILATELQHTEILRSDFVNDFSHELKTPLVSVNGLITLLKNENLSPEKRRQYLEIIEEETNRLAELTTNMLNLSKIEKQEILTDKIQVNISEQIRTCLLLLEKKWGKKNLSFSLEFDEVFVEGNEDMLKQVWMNIIDNAIKFAEDDSEIEIGLEQGDHFVSVSITNRGIEIKEEEISKIFNKFYQVGSGSSREGNGIGLSIVKRIVELHDGKIEAVSANSLTTFKVSLPIE